MKPTQAAVLFVCFTIAVLRSEKINAQWSLSGNTPTAPDFLGTTDNTNLRIRTNNTERMVILSGGDVGIGIASPLYKLDVNGSIRSVTGYTYGSTIGGTWDVWGTFARFQASANTDGISIATTKSPSSIRLQVNNGARGISMDGASTNFLFMGGSGETLSGIGNANGTGSLTLLYSTAPNTRTEGARLSATGNFLIGTATDGIYKLDVNGISRFTSTSYMNTGTNTSLVTTTTGGNPGIQIADNVRPSLTLNLSGVVARGIGIINSSGDIAINVPTFSGGNSHIFYGDGKTYLSSDVGIGVVSPTARLHSNGTVRFEGLTNNNALTQILATDASGNVSWRNASTLGVTSGTVWELTGNAGTNPATNFIGTTDVQPVVFKVANSEAMRFNTDRSVHFLGGASQTSAKFSTDNPFGNWININENSASPSAFSGIRLTLNDVIKTQIFHNDNAFSHGGSFDVASGNAEVLSRNGDVYLSTNSFLTHSLVVKNTTGNVGIGNTTPSYKLDVNGTARFGSNALASSLVINDLGDIGIGMEPTPNMAMQVIKDADATVGIRFENINTGGNAFTALQLGQDITTTATKFLNIGYANPNIQPLGVYQPAGSFIVNNGDGGLNMSAYSSTGTPKMRFFTGNGVEDGNMRMLIDESGKVGIGTTSLSDNNYKLFVETGIRTRKVKVDQTVWSDYVFYDDYKLPSLHEVEKFIQKNKHLPDVPSASEVEKNGLDLGGNQAVLLKKIEELTLYMIELNKKVDKLSEENASLKKKLDGTNK